MVTDGTMPHSNWLNHSHNHNLEMLLHIKGKYCVDEKGSSNILTTCIVKVGAHNPGAKMKSLATEKCAHQGQMWKLS